MKREKKTRGCILADFVLDVSSKVFAKSQCCFRTTYIL